VQCRSTCGRGIRIGRRSIDRYSSSYASTDALHTITRISRRQHHASGSICGDDRALRYSIPLKMEKKKRKRKAWRSDACMPLMRAGSSDAARHRLWLASFVAQASMFMAVVAWTRAAGEVAGRCFCCMRMLPSSYCDHYEREREITFSDSLHPTSGQRYLVVHFINHLT
jgi:hypothetical protein